MTIFPGELLHSYFIRLLIASGEFRAEKRLWAAITTGTGFWRKYPSIPLKGQYLLANTSPTHQVKLVCEHLPLEQSSLLYSSNRLIDLTEYIFKGKETPQYNNKVKQCREKKVRVSYCKACFKEQFLTHGATWFALDWFEHGYCSHHNATLDEIGCEDCRNQSFYKKLISTMQGQCITCGKVLWDVDSSQVADKIAISTVTRLPPRSKLLAPCFYKALYEFLKTLNNRYSSLLLREKAYVDFEKWHIKVPKRCLIKPLSTAEKFELAGYKSLPSISNDDSVYLPFNLEAFMQAVDNTPMFTYEFMSELIRKEASWVIKYYRFPYNTVSRSVMKAKSASCEKCQYTQNECVGSQGIARINVPPNNTKILSNYCEERMQGRLRLAMNSNILKANQ